MFGWKHFRVSKNSNLSGSPLLTRLVAVAGKFEMPFHYRGLPFVAHEKVLHQTVLQPTILIPSPYIHGPCRRFRGDQNDEDTRTFCGKFLYSAITSIDNAQHKNCLSSGIDDRPGRDLFRVLKRSPISQPYTLGLRRGYSDGKAVGNTTGLQRRFSLLQSLCRALGQTEASSNFEVLSTTRPRFEPHEQRSNRHEASAQTTMPHVRQLWH